MTLDEAKKIAATFATIPAVDRSLRENAIVTLFDALRAAEAQVAHLNAKLDATHTDRCFHCEQTVTEATSARQASDHAPVVVKAGDYPNVAKRFDAEAAFKAQAAQLIHAIGSGRQYVTCDDLLLAIEAARAAGRGAP